VRLRGRLRAQLPAKLAVWLGLALGICIPYFTLQRLALFPRRAVPVLALDHAIDFQPGALWAYLSVGLLVPLAPLLATRRSELVRYARGLALLCVACFVAFLFVPVEGPRPAVPPDHRAYQWLVALDRPANSFPSLHAGLALYSLLFGLRVLRGALAPAARRAVTGLGTLWVALILYSTLATRQHWAIDLPAGMALAFAAYALAWRSAEPVVQHGELPVAARSSEI